MPGLIPPPAANDHERPSIPTARAIMSVAAPNRQNAIWRCSIYTASPAFCCAARNFYHMVAKKSCGDRPGVVLRSTHETRRSLTTWKKAISRQLYAVSQRRDYSSRASTERGCAILSESRAPDTICIWVSTSAAQNPALAAARLGKRQCVAERIADRHLARAPRRVSHPGRAFLYFFARSSC